MGLFSKKYELPTPPAIRGDRNAAELLRAWVAHGDLHVVLRHDAFGPDAGAWGVALVDLARHVANAFQQSAGVDPQVVLERIRHVFDAEWAKPTDDPTGSVAQ